MSEQMDPTDPDPTDLSDLDLTVMLDEDMMSMSITGQDLDDLALLASLEIPEAEELAKVPDQAKSKSKGKGKAEKAPAPSKPAKVERIGSPTLENIPKDRRPNPSTVCEVCPASMWFATPTEVKCYCKEMYLITWSTSEPGPLTSCDGMIRAMEKAAENSEG